MRSSLEETFAAIREQNSDVINVIKDKVDVFDEMDDEGIEEDKKKGMVVEEEDPDWPVDAETGWGIRASEYFEKHPIKNVVGDDGVVIDWEGELDDNLVKEINCLEWEAFAFHPSPLIVLVFERYNRAKENWKALKELEKAAKVYWNAKDRLPPRTVKLDMNLETDLAYALMVRDCPQILFLRGNRIIYRETQSRTADELVQLIAHFYYKAKKPSWMKDQKLYT
ncbi:thioredoxin-like fold domain-containing protein MRL7, chloroplastic [Bidens hawaiensis]|uniref:thioredoxin-like fold domain-containing protein MRL7, chloroplastic n=1 Tax=Bidens hawaiensis TaxID=980011 RepID=UPI00404A43DB